jgi:hypothetical protein
MSKNHLTFCPFKMGDEWAGPAAVAAAAVGEEEERGLRPQLLILRV